jgi:hypothetical protein
VKHHYLPQFYLREFTDPDVPHGHDPYIWVYSLAKCTWRRRGPHNVAAESDYYAFTDQTGNKSHEVEKMLSQVESMTAPVVREKVLNQQLLGEEDRATIATFVALMLMRVPAQHEHIGNFKAEVAQRILQVIYQVHMQNPETLEAFKRDYRKETGKHDLDDLRPEHLDPTRYKIRTTRPAAIGISFSALTDCARVIAEMGWTFLVSQPPNYFITSDYPFSMLDPTNENQAYGHGLAFKNVEVSLPLTRNLALFAGWQSKGTRWLPASQRIVKQVNLRSMLSASRFLVAPKPDFPGADKLPSATAEK